MNNFNTYSPRMGQMSSSSMFFPNSQNDFKTNSAFTYANNGGNFNLPK